MSGKSAVFKCLFGGILAVAVAGCGGEEAGNGGVPGLFGESGEQGATAPPLQLEDAHGNAITTVDAHEPLTISLNNLDANTHYRVRITGPNDELLHPGDGYVIVTDEDGDARSHTVVQGLQITQSSMPSPEGVGVTGSYLLEIVDENGEVAHDQTFEVVNNGYVYCADSAGNAEASFTPTDSVYAQVEQGEGSLADGSYPVHVLSDLNPALFDGSALPASTASVTISGGSGIVDLGTFEQGAWDVVVDVDEDGRFTLGTDLISRARRLHACFAIQDAAAASAVVEQIASDTNGNYREIFDPLASSASIRDVFARTTPAQPSQTRQAQGVQKYVVQHQDTWTDGDTLTDETDGVEVDPIQSFCTSAAPWRVWPRQSMSAGCYDVVIDVNSNGVYDEGTDLVDNVDAAGSTTCGLRVADASCTDNISITSHQDGEVFQSTAIMLVGSVSASDGSGQYPGNGQVTITSGEESTTVNLSIDGSGAFSADVPLFAGANELTVSFIYADGTTCAKTLTLTNGSAAAGNVKFRAQLLWDGSTDMDLHLVRPTGTYWDSTDDCYFANCAVGLSGAGSNAVDWGEGGDADDPKLDVDCIACGNGVENIWVNEIPHNGDYTVYVDAYSGTETNVRVGIFIGSSQVATVNCGDMSSGTTTDTCRVGTISWVGGDDGTGAFTPDGTTGARSTFSTLSVETMDVHKRTRLRRTD